MCFFTLLGYQILTKTLPEVIFTFSTILTAIAILYVLKWVIFSMKMLIIQMYDFVLYMLAFSGLKCPFIVHYSICATKLDKNIKKMFCFLSNIGRTLKCQNHNIFAVS